MTKPDWCPQWAWDTAERHLRPDQFGIMQPAQVLLARVAIEAERRGMGRAAEIVDGESERILALQDGKSSEIDQNLRMMAVLLPSLSKAIRAAAEELGS